MNELSNIDLSNAAPPTVQPKPVPLLERDGNTDDYILRIDNSSLEKFQTCPRSSEFYHVHRREKPGGAALNFGGAVHEALEHLYRHGFDQLNLIEAQEIAVKYLNSKTQVYNEREHRNPELLVHVIEKYYNTYGGDLVPYTHESKPAVEIPFAITLGEFPLDCSIAYTGRDVLKTSDAEDEPLYIRNLIVLWTGKIDLAVQQSDLAICDHKTSSVEGPTFFDQFKLSQPVHGYIWAARQIFGADITRFILNAIFVRKVTATGKGVTFARRDYFFNEFHLDEWRRDVEHEISNFVNCLRTGYFPKSPVWCMGKFGACPYHDVCTLPDTRQQSAMLYSQLYTNVTWSPLHKD